MQGNGHFPKSGSLISTANYVYNTADCLGKGATASVYLGRERVSSYIPILRTLLVVSPLVTATVVVI